MKRSLWNIIIDSLSLVVFMGMISTGLIIKFVLPPGSGRIEQLLQSHRMDKTIELFMGLTRHEWGEIHFYISVAFLALLITHLILHWNWINATLFGVPGHPQPFRRRAIAWGILIVITLSLIFPWVGSKQTITKAEIIELRGLTQ